MEVTLESPRGDRSRVTLGPLLGPPGSQGEVRAIVQAPSAAAKLLRNPPAMRLGERLDAMFADSDALFIRRGPVVRLSWPVARVRRLADDSLIGYAQPRLAPPRYFPMRDTFGALRVRALSGMTWGWHVTVAADLAETMAMIAGRGHVVGDLAPDNLFVTARGEVAFVDVDGWQLAGGGDESPLPCPFSRSEYTAPEYLDTPAGTLRTEASDRWALGVLVAQVLFLGYHPFAGIAPGAPPPYEEEANVRARHCWLTGSALSLPPGVPPAALLPDGLRQMVTDCLGEGYGSPASRPSAAAWAGALRGLSATLVQCQARTAHAYPRELPGCPWCEMVADGTPDRFPDSGSSPGAGGETGGAHADP